MAPVEQMSNVSMAMFLESCLSFNDSEAFPYKHVTYVKSVPYSRKLISLCSEKLDWSTYPQKTISLNSEAKNTYKLAKPNLSLRTTLSLTDKNMFWKIWLENDYNCLVMRDYKGFFWPRKRNHIINDKY